MTKTVNPTLMRALVALREIAQTGHKLSFTFDHGVVVDKEPPMALLYLTCEDDGELNLNVRLDGQFRLIGSFSKKVSQSQLTNLVHDSVFRHRRAW